VKTWFEVLEQRVQLGRVIALMLMRSFLIVAAVAQADQIVLQVEPTDAGQGKQTAPDAFRMYQSRRDAMVNNLRWLAFALVAERETLQGAWAGNLPPLLPHVLPLNRILKGTVSAGQLDAVAVGCARPTRGYV
jgi:hypothetical protein